jgi:quinol monooxygenase YgiN
MPAQFDPGARATQLEKPSSQIVAAGFADCRDAVDRGNSGRRGEACSPDGGRVTISPEQSTDLRRMDELGQALRIVRLMPVMTICPTRFPSSASTLGCLGVARINKPAMMRELAESAEHAVNLNPHQEIQPMIHVIATIELVEGGRGAFLKEFREVVPKVKEEAGCLEYGPTVDAASGISAQGAPRQNVVTVVEKWADLAALKAHLVAPHMEAYRPRVKALVRSTTLQILEPV